MAVSRGEARALGRTPGAEGVSAAAASTPRFDGHCIFFPNSILREAAEGSLAPLAGLVTEEQLAEFDLVLVPFEVFREEAWFAAASSSSALSCDDSSKAVFSTCASGVSLRSLKKYRTLLSPLVMLRWWRLVVDEAQLSGGWLGFSEFASRSRSTPASGRPP